MRKCFFDDQDQLIYIVFQDFLLVCLSGYARINIVHNVSWSWVMPDNKAKCKFTCLGTQLLCMLGIERKEQVCSTFIRTISESKSCLSSGL